MATLTDINYVMRNGERVPESYVYQVTRSAAVNPDKLRAELTGIPSIAGIQTGNSPDYVLVLSTAELTPQQMSTIDAAVTNHDAALTPAQVAQVARQAARDTAQSTLQGNRLDTVIQRIDDDIAEMDSDSALVDAATLAQLRTLLKNDIARQKRMAQQMRRAVQMLSRE